jgi:hypothetical protein
MVAKAIAMAMAVVLASILSIQNHLLILHCQQQQTLNSTSLTVLAKILNGDGMMQTILLTQVNKKGTSCSDTETNF